MVKEEVKKNIPNIIFLLLISLFLFFSFSPTLLDLSYQNNLYDKNREFTLEHNYYWPDFNLYVSKIRQGYEGSILAKERYTTEPHSGSLIQWLYVLLGIAGKTFGLSIPWSYQLGRILFAPLLLLVILLIIKKYFLSFKNQVFVLVITLISGSFPRPFTDAHGAIRIGRYMEWWSNMDPLQRTTHLPHILLAQAISFFLLYKLLIERVLPQTSLSAGAPLRLSSARQREPFHLRHLFTINQILTWVFYILLGNFLGLIFPPSLMTLNLVIVFYVLISLIKNRNRNIKFVICYLLFVISTLPSLLYIFFLTKTIPWSALVDAHKMTRMPVALDQFILATGPIFYLATLGMVTLIIKRKIHWYPLIYFVVVSILFASYFSISDDQSPLRFTQTGLFIPFGILGSYFLVEVWRWINEQLTMRNAQIKTIVRMCYLLFVICYLTMSSLILYSSYDWQREFIVERAHADHPLVPYPPQTLPPLKSWMDAIRFLENNTSHDDVVIAQITAANYIPAYAGNTVWWGQTNTYDYFRKQKLMEDFFKGEMSESQAIHLIAEGNIKYVFVGPQERDMMTGKKITDVYPFLNSFFKNSTVEIYKAQ
ncbi:hypothetical protein A3D77_03175 [Candidatus Gottesmanbacteria bacterium RIFCSPHIGHO2_02_FULL_39_11]|uniref:Glycosyltransferase RgtA/B/C/D-like domain-containing protein n=1 Tax=Candidatus Gottesmanbacteria bacterium RIFCSPHIGHO2_02_FULL_39_11 TaxID=1798382 RepID=A0A1F5ZVC7_9BACT|nr:MAG: hypothetical protein A3D77_03175 [Candidatus Gottesmanbacteria bacterium RIFCSPHIGHO2_02_FULL_39_11]